MGRRKKDAPVEFKCECGCKDFIVIGVLTETHYTTCTADTTGKVSLGKKRSVHKLSFDLDENIACQACGEEYDVDAISAINEERRKILFRKFD